MKSLYLLLFLPLSVFAGSLSWVAPTEREDGSLLSPDEIAGYRVYWGAETENYQNQINVEGNTTSIEYDFPIGDTFLVVTTIDTDGRESLYSIEKFFPVQPVKPRAPTGIEYAP